MDSHICCPTRIVGFKLRLASWNAMAMSCPRQARIARSDKRKSSVPMKIADPVTFAVSGSNPVKARQLTVLPAPDSPTIANVLPANTL
jgi:hypothetical protein